MTAWRARWSRVLLQALRPNRSKTTYIIDNHDGKSLYQHGEVLTPMLSSFVIEFTEGVTKAARAMDMLYPVAMSLRLCKDGAMRRRPVKLVEARLVAGAGMLQNG